jgi:hypothetical protein
METGNRILFLEEVSKLASNAICFADEMNNIFTMRKGASGG